MIVNKSYSDSIISFKKPKGSLIVYNAYGVHRAKPSKDKSLIRKSLFFQVDKELERQKQIDLAHYKKKKLVREKSDE